MNDLLGLLFVGARDAWALGLLLVVELLTSCRADRVDRLRAGATAPWWRDRAYVFAARSQAVSRVWVVLALGATFVSTNHAGLVGAQSLVTTAFVTVLVTKMWGNLARGDSLARAFRRSLDRMAQDRVDAGDAPLPSPASSSIAPPSDDPP